MCGEYHRLQEEAREVDREIRELQENARVSSASELAALERRLDELSIKSSSLTKAMILLRSVNDSEFGTQSKSGSRFVETMLTVIETCRQQQRSVHEHVTAAIQAHLNNHPAPSMLTEV